MNSLHLYLFRTHFYSFFSSLLIRSLSLTLSLSLSLSLNSLVHSLTLLFFFVRQLSRLGVDVCEAGFPIASPGDFDAVSAIAEEVGT